MNRLQTIGGQTKAFLPAHLIQPQRQTRETTLLAFGSQKQDDADNPPLKRPSLWMRPMVKLMAFLYTRPQSVRRLLPNTNHMMDPKHLHLFDPMQSVKFKSTDGVQIKGHWLPAKSPSNKTVILGHGYTADWREMLALGDVLRNKGYHCLLFDFRAHGASGGTHTSMGFNEGKDIAGAVKFVKAEYPTQSNSLFYVGHSMGAASMMMTPKSLEGSPQELAMLNQHLKGMVLDAPYHSFNEIARRFIKEIRTVEADNVLVQKLGGLLEGKFGDKLLDGMRYMVKDYLKLPVDLFSLMPAQILADSPLGQKPILITHGDKDNVTPFDHGLRNFDTLKKKNPDKTEFYHLVGEEHMSRTWSPTGKKNEAYWSSERGNFSDQVVQFLDKIKFQGFRRKPAEKTNG